MFCCTGVLKVNQMTLTLMGVHCSCGFRFGISLLPSVEQVGTRDTDKAEKKTFASYLLYLPPQNNIMYGFCHELICLYVPLKYDVLCLWV